MDWMPLAQQAQADQMQAGVATIAALMAAYYVALLAAGVPVLLAERLTCEWQALLLAGKPGPGP